MGRQNNMLVVTAALTATIFCGTANAAAKLLGSPMPNQNFPDPTVIHAEGKWWAFATPEKATLPHVPLAVSDDYKDWRMVRNADGSLYDALPKLPSWVRNAADDAKPHALWAPHISKLDDGTFVLYYAAGKEGTVSTHCISAAKADNIKGPYKAIDGIVTCPDNSQGAFDIFEFKDWKVKGDWGLPTVQNGKTAVRRENCDGKVDGKCGNSWFDSKWSEGGYGGKRYIVYKHQSADRTTKTPIELQEVQDDGVTLVGKPTILMDWKEGIDHGSIEAPCIYKTPAGKYLLTYSKGNTATKGYTASYAVADNVKGPYVRKGDILKTGDFDLNAPGGAEITWNGERMVFHEMMQPIGKPYEGKRKMHAANIEVDDKTGKITFDAL